MHSRIIRRTIDDRINPFMPSEAMEQIVGVGGVAGLSENVQGMGYIAMVTGGIIGSILLYKGKYLAGIGTMAAGVAIPVVVDYAMRKGDQASYVEGGGV